MKQMTKIWRVCLYEYRRHVFRRRFLIALLSLPFFVVLSLGVGALLVSIQMDETPLGYVDQAGVLNLAVKPASDRLFSEVPLVAYPSPSEAEAALKAGDIQGYYVLPPTYLKTGETQLIYLDNKPAENARQTFQEFVRTNLLSDVSPPIAKRLREGATFMVRMPDGNTVTAGTLVLQIIVPMLAGLGFIITIFITSGYLMQAVVEEKENRTVEILLTSISPGQLMAGKVTGITAVGLTQLLVWGMMIAIGIMVGKFYFGWLQNFSLPPGLILTLIGVMLPAFVMIAALMTTVGATITQSSEAQQITGLFTLPVVAPYWFTGLLLNHPNSPVAIALSFFPLTAPVTITFRAGATAIPTWQLALNIGILIISAAGAIWLAGRAFRLGMLQYGQRLSWRTLLKKESPAA